MKIAYFGLGKMGLGPAINLVRAGHEVQTAVHRNPFGAEKLREQGGIIASDPAEAVRDADVIISIVPDDAALKSLFSQEKLLNALKPGAILIDMTSCSAQAICQVAERLQEYQVEVLDAPVSGGVKAADDGTMTMICAGKQEVFDHARPILDVIGEYIILVSERLGDDKKIKSLNNLLAAVDRAATGEIARLAGQHDLDPRKVYDVISHSSGDSGTFRLTWQKLQNQDYRATFTVAHMRKDVNLALDLAEELHLPIAEAVQDYYEKAMCFKDEDSCAVAKVNYEK